MTKSQVLYHVKEELEKGPAYEAQLLQRTILLIFNDKNLRTI